MIDWELTGLRMINSVKSWGSICQQGKSCLIWDNLFYLFTGIDTYNLPSSKTEIQSWAHMNAVCPQSFGCQKAVSMASPWDAHSARPFTLAHNATKVWWLSNLLKQAPWQSHGFTPGPQSLYQRKLHPPQIPTKIKHTGDIIVSPVFFFFKNIPVVLPY